MLTLNLPYANYYIYVTDNSSLPHQKEAELAKVAILTNFMEFFPGYSLTGIILDQVEMLKKYGHDVHLYVNTGYNDNPDDPGKAAPEGVPLHKRIPFSHLVDYKSINDLSDEHRALVSETASNLREDLKDTDIVFTHDFVFTGWNLPYGLACAEASADLPDTRWMHWIHSVPSARFDWWDLKIYGPKHKLVYPNKTDQLMCAEMYHTYNANVLHIPHIKDYRTWFDFCGETRQFIEWNPGIMQSDIVQVYPASVDRLEAKRVREVILIFSYLKKMGFSVNLTIAAQWATGRQQKEDITHYKKIASRNGLTIGEDLVFTPDFKPPKYEVGVSKRILRELFLMSNLFIFPTREESFGLVMPEASLTGGCLMVLNKSLTQQMEISGFSTLYFDFGSFSNNHCVDNENQYFSDIAKIIVGRLNDNESIMTRTHLRKTLNMDYVYNKYYGPAIAKSVTWG